MANCEFDIAIVGSGPAGMCAALVLARLAPTLRVVVLEKGKNRYSVPSADANVTEGWGGAGAFSDGKYNLDDTGRVGAQLVGNGFMTPKRWQELLRIAGALYVEFGGNAENQFGHADPLEERRVQQIRSAAFGARLDLHRFPILHLGSSTATKIVENWRLELEKLGVTTITDCYVRSFQERDGEWRLFTDGHGEFDVKRVIACPGRSGAGWFQKVAPDLGIALENNGVDIGVRVETTDAVMQELIRLFYESKFYFRSGNDDPLRTFCMCPGGTVAVEEYRDTGIFCANGHTDDGNRTTNCNFSVLQTQRFTVPFNDPHAYALMIAQMHTALSGGIIVQRLGDLRRHRRSTPARMLQGMVRSSCEDSRVIPGDIGLAMPGRFIHGILNFLVALDTVAPGINNPDTLLYSPEIKWNAVRARADHQKGFEALPGFHVAGDGTGYTRGLNGASVMGLDVGLWVAQEMGEVDVSVRRDRLFTGSHWDRLFAE